MGGGGHGHGHEPPYKIPDYRIYKVEDAAELMGVKRALTKEGLKDPWLRNEVWKYPPHETNRVIGKAVFARGMKYGFIAAVITTAIGWALEARSGSKHGHGHGEH